MINVTVGLDSNNDAASRRAWQRHGRATGLVVLGCLLFAPTGLFAQRADLRVDRGPHHAGVPVRLSVSSDGFSGEPNCTGVSPPGTTLSKEGTSQQISLTGRGRTVKLTWSFAFIAATPGTYTVGPFEVTDGKVTKQTKTVTIQVRSVPTTDDVEIKLSLPDKPITLGQRTPVTVELATTEEMLQSIQAVGYTLSVPLLGMPEFDFDSDDAKRAKSQLTLIGGPVKRQLAATTLREQRGRETWILIRSELTVIPKTVGEFDVPPAVFNTQRVTRWGRGMFGRREAAAASPVMTRDLERTLVVVDLPPGKPESFAGAIGRGFNVEVAADRTVVQAGDPIRLTIRIRGEGNLETVSLPPLSADGGLSPSLFRLPPDHPAGRMEDGTKVFEVSVRAMSEQITELPPIAYSWFDPELGRYETARSRPIALSVKQGKIVGANDVVGGSEQATNPGPAEAIPTAGTIEPGSAALPRGDVGSAADLSIVIATEKLIHRAPHTRPLIGYVLYGVPILAIALALFGRMRASIDPAVARRQKSLAEALREIRNAGDQPEVDGTRTIAAALRAMLVEVPAARTPAIDQFLAECEAVVYAPAGREGTVSTALHQRAVDFAEGIERLNRSGAREQVSS